MKSSPRITLTGGKLAAAIACVALTSGFLVVLSWRLVSILSGRDWCSTAVGADKATGGVATGIDSLTACVGLLTIQVKALALDSHIAIGILALCLGALVVIVLAGGMLDLRVDKAGLNAQLRSETDPGEAAQATADAAQEQADEIKSADAPDAAELAMRAKAEAGL